MSADAGTPNPGSPNEGGVASTQTAPPPPPPPTATPEVATLHPTQPAPAAPVVPQGAPAAAAPTPPAAAPVAPAPAAPAAPPAVEQPAPVPPVADEAPPPAPPASDSFPSDPAAPPSDPPAPPAPEEEGCSCEEGAPAWVMTFGDLMSLLLCFFILLFSMSSTDAAKFQAAAQSLREALGEASGELTSAAIVPTEDSIAAIIASSEAVVDATMDVIAERLNQFVEENGLEETVEVSKDANGVFLRMSDQALFPPGSANIDQSAQAVVEQLGEIINVIGIPFIVSGHTDNVPIRSNVFTSNWELSAARAAGVARTLVARGHDAAKVTVEAYGEYRPIADNTTAEGRAQNRRVELYYSRETLQGDLEQRGVIENTSETEAASEPDASEPTPTDTGS